MYLQSWLRKINSKGDFIANMRYVSSDDTFILIHQEPKVDIVYDIDSLNKMDEKMPQLVITLQFESNVYDSVKINNSLIVSNKNMPVRLYSLPTNSSSQISWASFNDKKPNTEQYLFPLQLAKHQNVVIGGGKKFLSQYDCTKFVARRVKTMAKKFISALELLDDSVVVAGQFDGSLTFLDLREEQSGQSIKPHVDLVTRIKRIPQKEHHLVSLARKDNYSYLWDCRKLDTFVNCYEQRLYGNQRTGLDVSSDGQTLYLGDENGLITGRSIQSGQITFNHNSSVNRCISSVCATQRGIVFAVGERQFPFDTTVQKNVFIGFVATK